ncbi:helix-turn-helix transcriptional regulator [Nocardioides sp. LML1-1-1.1]|uniref:helix-turn-helix transcriptional regulator n=1 Tax=Nocardioides sp. LML1-1-1.1 TaxID=3135248 RepID=UPI00343DA9A4
MSPFGQFLRQRRAALRPAEVGLVDYGTRRVPGLRREEVALLAGVSVTYYTRLEQGHSVNASESVLGSLARALALTPVERQHLFDLAGVRDRPATRTGTTPDFARPGTVRLLDSMAAVPALLLGKRTEVLAWNALGHALVAGHLDPRGPEQPDVRPNLTRLLFLDGATRALYPDWATEAARAVASLRLLSGRFADDPPLASLIGELTLKSPEFARMWAEHPVDSCMSGTKLLRHPVLGDLELDFEVLSVPDDSGHRMLTYTAAPDSRAGRVLARLLASDDA